MQNVFHFFERSGIARIYVTDSIRAIWTRSLSVKKKSFRNGIYPQSVNMALCLTEKLKIIREDPESLLNKQLELVSKCRHKNKVILANIK